MNATPSPISSLSEGRGTAAVRLGRGVALLAVLLYFNSLLSFENVPSTLWIRLAPVLSLELAIAIPLLALLPDKRRSSFAVRATLAVLLLFAAVLRYVDVTTEGAMGRVFNVHSDLPHVHRVVGMFWEALPLQTGLLVVGVAALAAALVVAVNGLGLGVLAGALRAPRIRSSVFAGSAFFVTFAAASGLAAGGSGLLVSRPTAAMLVKQGTFLSQARALATQAAEDPSRLLDGARPGWVSSSDLSGLGGADVLLIFLESYGSTLIDDAHHFDAISPRFARLEERLTSHGFHLASTKVLSPTFAGGSWRAHATLMSGVRIGNEHLYNVLLRSERKTLSHLLAAAGYRTVSAEPGIQREWPEGEFFDFDRIYDAEGLAYVGADIGWWKIPDQYTLYKIYREELRPEERQPLFAKIALIMSHIPYFPIPPFVEDWSRFDDGTAYDRGLPSIAADDYRNLQELSSRYVEAFVYELDILEDFLIRFVPENALVIIVGDHQPPKLVTHDNDSWAVPLHLVSRREELVTPFFRYGLRAGIVPRHPSELPMEDFLPAFLEVFDGKDEVATKGL